MSVKNRVKKTIRKNTVIIIAAIMAAIMFIPEEHCLASSAAISFTTDKTDLRVGENVTVELSLDADVFPGDFEGYISYNSDVLEYIEGPECINGSEGILRIDDKVTVSNMNTRKYVMTFTAIGRGYCEFTMRGQPELYEFEAGYLMSVSSGSTAVQVQAAVTASNECRLESLKISPGTLTPAFSSDITEYSTDVTADTERLIISAAPIDGEAVVHISGNDVLNEGQNRIIVLVTAEDGTEKKYEIYAVRGKGAEDTEEESTPTPAADSEDEQTDAQANKAEGYITAVKEDNGVYISAGGRYLVCALPEGMDIPNGYTKTAIMLDGISITAYTPSEDLDSDYLLFVLQKEGGKAGFYCYDRVEKTIQRYASGSSRTTVNSTSAGYATMEDNALVESYDKSLGTLLVIIAVLSGVCILLLIAVVRLFLKCRGIKNDDF